MCVCVCVCVRLTGRQTDRQCGLLYCNTLQLLAGGGMEAVPGQSECFTCLG